MDNDAEQRILDVQMKSCYTVAKTSLLVAPIILMLRVETLTFAAVAIPVCSLITPGLLAGSRKLRVLTITGLTLFFLGAFGGALILNLASSSEHRVLGRRVVTFSYYALGLPSIVIGVGAAVAGYYSHYRKRKNRIKPDNQET